MSRTSFFPAFRNDEQRLVPQHCRLTPDLLLKNNEKIIVTQVAPEHDSHAH